MLFAAWWRTDRPIREPLASTVRALLDAPGAARSNGPSASLATWPPAHLEPVARAAVAYAVASTKGHAPERQPIVRLEGEALTLVAGPLPEYPLYYVRGPSDEFVLACSRLEPLALLLPHAAVSAQRLVRIVRWAHAADPDPGATVYAGIRRMRPCETLVANAEGVRSERHIPRVGATYRSARPDDLAYELREQLDAAVERSIGGARRVAVLVSGGLDSSGILALAAARCRGATARELTALSVQFAAPEDDRPHFNELMGALGLTPLRLSAESAAPWFRKSLCVDGQPVPFSGMCLDMMLSATAAERQADVTLHGAAGDLMLGGTQPFAQLALRGHPIAAMMAACRLRVPWPTTPWGRVRSLVLTPLVPRRLLRGRRRRAAHASWMTPRFRDLLQPCLEAAERGVGPMPDTPDAWMEELCNDQGRSDSADAGGQSLSLTGCAPIDVYTDLEFVRFMLQIDPMILSHGDEYKGLYRLAMKGLLPERLRTRQDKGSFEPGIAAAALAANALEMLRDLLSLDALATRGLVEPASFRPIFDVWLAGVRRGERTDGDPADEHWQQVWQLLCVEAFLREHGLGRHLV